MVQNTFTASNAKDIPQLRRAVNDGFTNLATQVNAEAAVRFIFSNVTSVSSIPTNLSLIHI